MADEDEEVEQKQTLVTPVQERFISAADVPDQWGLNMLIYGDPGAGKTTLAASAQDSKFGKDVFFMDVEGGTRSIADRKDITVFRPEKWSDIGEAYDYLVTETHKFKTIVVDSITDTQEMGLSKLVVDSGRGRPSQDEYVMSNSLIKSFVGDLVNLSKTLGWNVIFNAKVREFAQEGGGIIARPALTDKAVEGVVGLVDVVAYLSVDGDGNRKLNLRPHGIYTAKVRQPKTGPQLPALIEDPDLGQLLDIMKS
jgi:phage nucleotide-binding protein